MQDGNIPYAPAEGAFLNYNPITGDWGVLYEVCDGDEGQWRASDDGCDFDMQTGKQKEPTGIGLIPYPSAEASQLLAEYNGSSIVTTTSNNVNQVTDSAASISSQNSNTAVTSDNNDPLTKCSDVNKQSC